MDSRQVFDIAQVRNKVALREETQLGITSGFSAAFL